MSEIKNFNFSQSQNNCYTDWCRERNIETSLLSSLYQTDLWIPNHRGHEFPLSLTLNILKTRTVDRNHKFSERILLNSCNIQSNVHANVSAHRAALRTKTDLTFQAFYFRFLHFAAQFCFHCKSVSIPLEAIWVKFDTVAWFSLINHNILLRIATNEIASFCTDNRLRRMAFLVFAKVRKGRFSSYVERFWNKKASSLVV